jgi:hypothetical protein
LPAWGVVSAGVWPAWGVGDVDRAWPSSVVVFSSVTVYVSPDKFKGNKKGPTPLAYAFGVGRLCADVFSLS